ncbi:MAG: dual specificity protein phosphatase family protein [Thermoguttaceae bacterium]|jgi:atypical dual specificity phosphatase|nr:dual specificity protein phosphatase family protein [Thermoguttaceae bacterium]
MNLDQILPNIFLGSCPTSLSDIERLKAEFGITAVLNVQTDEDMAYWETKWADLEAGYQQRGIECRRVPVVDFQPDDLARRLPDCVQALEKLLRAGHTVYVHCSAGMNRSPSTVVAYLHWTQGMTLDEALRFVMQRRYCDPYLDAIRQATANWAAGGG